MGSLTTMPGFIVGTPPGVVIPSGMVGESIESVVSMLAPVSLAVGYTTITSIVLPPGNWTVSGMIGFKGAPTTNVTRVAGIISLSTFPGALDDTSEICFSPGAVIASVSGLPRMDIAPTKLSVRVPTTVYLMAYAEFTVSTMVGFGDIDATRF